MSAMAKYVIVQFRTNQINSFIVWQVFKMLFAYSIFAFFKLIECLSPLTNQGQLTPGVVCNSNGNRKVLKLNGNFDVDPTLFKSDSNISLEFYSDSSSIQSKILSSRSSESFGVECSS